MMKKAIAIVLSAAVFLSLVGCECKHEWLPATCTTAVTCSKCGEVKGEPLGHNWIEATCSQAQTCEICGMTYGNPLEHEWIDATCIEPKTCLLCGKKEGSVTEHKWVEATCTSPKICSVCGTTEGEQIEHSWMEATCTAPKTCSVCGITEGTRAEHTWIEATCTEPQTCSVCGATSGKEAGHSVDQWTVEIQSTCTEKGTQTGICTICEEKVTEELPLAEHVAGEWETTIEPSVDKQGEHERKCVVCGQILEKEKFSLTAEEIKAIYIKKCSTINYDAISRYPSEHIGEYVVFRGVVLQVCSEAESAKYYSTYRVATSGYYDNVVMLMVDNYGTGERILEDDWITVYGQFDDLYSYETIMGAQVTIPKIIAEYVDR